MTISDDTTHDAREPRHRSSSTARIIENLQLFGYQPSADEPDPRPLPDTDRIEGSISDMFDLLAGTFRDTRLEPDLEDLLWCVTNLFHKKAARVQRHLDENEDRQKRSQQEQDGSEIRSVELERLIIQGHSLIERRAAFSPQVAEIIYLKGSRIDKG